MIIPRSYLNAWYKINKLQLKVLSNVVEFEFTVGLFAQHQ